MVRREAIYGRRLTARKQGSYACEIQVHETLRRSQLFEQLDVGEAQAW
jgi:hypothetical protein